MKQCLLIEDEPVHRMLLRAALRKYGCCVAAPENADELDRVFAMGQKFDLVLFDGCLWGSLGWLQIAPDVKRCLAQDGELLCNSASPMTADVASRYFGQPVYFVGKDPELLERFLLEPQLVR